MSKDVFTCLTTWLTDTKRANQLRNGEVNSNFFAEIAYGMRDNLREYHWATFIMYA